jgi:putative FmdB family regulatory protein
MPRFDFRCTACSTTFEESIPFGSADLPPCPACGKKTEKLLSAPPAIQFKGSGFYKTDSRPATAPKKTESPSASDASSAPAAPEKAPAPEKSPVPAPKTDSPSA